MVGGVAGATPRGAPRGSADVAAAQAGQARGDQGQDGQAQPQQRRAAVSAAPGSLGTWVNGETSSIDWDSRRTWPNRAISTITPTTVQAPATDARGASPNSTTAAPATASDAGSWTMAAPSSRVTSGPAEPVRSP